MSENHSSSQWCMKACRVSRPRSPGCAQASAEDGGVDVVDLGAAGKLTGQGLRQRAAELGGTAFEHGAGGGEGDDGGVRSRSRRFLARAPGMAAKIKPAGLGAYGRARRRAWRG